MAEIPFERLLVGLEVARGTAQANPSRYLNLAGTVTPRKERYRPEESRGTLAEYYRSIDVRRWAEFEGEGGLDVYTLPLLLNTIVKGGVPGAGTAAASLTVDPAGANNALDWEAIDDGTEGNLISVEYIDPAANSSPLDLDLDGNAIKVYLATDGGGVITTIADDISAAVAVHPVISLLVTCVDNGGDDGSGVVTAMAQAYLTGGTSNYVATPGGGTLSRLWTFEPTMDEDDLKSMTLYWGDPNIQEFQSAFGMIDELTITADATGTDGATLSISGQAQFPSKTAPGSVPSMLAGPLLMPANMQLWIDTVAGANPIGTTAITGRVLSAEVTIPSGIARKWLAAGPTGTLNFQGIGRGKRHAEMTVTFELPDMTEYDLWAAENDLKVRLRINGPLIEAGFYHYVEVDIYGPFDGMDWGENEGANRTIQLTILSEYNEDDELDWSVKIQSDRDTL
jgi:hypothetical protein